MSKESMKMALDNLIAEYHMENSSFARRVDDIFKEALAEQPAKDEFKAAYIEAMVASNEAGFAGMSAAETIRELSRMVAEQPAQQKQMVGWQPAETAPKDDRILFLPKKDEQAVIQDPPNICWWSSHHNGWRSDLCEDFGGTEEFDWWMPLPKAPSTEENT